MKFGSREILFTLVMVALLFCSWYFVFRKADERIAELNADTVQRRLKLDQLKEATARIANMNAEIESLQQRIRMFEAKLPRESQTPEIVQQISRQAHGRQLLAVDSFTAPANPLKASGYYELPIRLVMHGDFRSFYDFLLETEKMTRITRINQMKLTKINELDGSMTADLTLSIFFAPDTAAAGK